MSTMSARQSQSPPSTPHGSKLSKFLHKSRDRSKSMIDTSTSNIPSAGSSSSSISEGSKIRSSRSIVRTASRKDKAKEKEKQKEKGSGSSEREQKFHPSQDILPTDSLDDDQPADDDQQQFDPATDGPSPTPDDTPVIVEPVSIPRPRTRSERPLSENYPSVAFYPSSSTNRLTDFPSRLSGWFAHTFSTSSTDLTLPTLLSQQHLATTGGNPSSPKGKGSALLTAAKHGTSKVMRYVLDSDATPDKCEDPIWLLGVQHSGYEAAPAPPPSVGRRSSVGSRRSPSSLSSSTSSSSVMPGADASLSQSQPTNPAGSTKDPGRHWPPAFYADFTSRIWLTYRSQFIPIRDIALEELDIPPPTGAVSASPQPKRSFWNLGGDKCWSSDAGWGCMVRTGQSLLANTLLHVHLGRDWRKPPHPVLTVDYATYVQLLSWFLDDPSCPFSVHRMTIVGKQLGTRIGQWFGPAIAAQAIRTLVRAFPEAGLGVFYAGDGGTVYESEVIAASHSGVGSPRKGNRRYWGDRAVLILIGQKLGLTGVNEIYFDSIKAFLKWPQSVGIAGGRPSSSYYFVGTQADSLFYLDPHHARPAIPLRPPPSNLSNAGSAGFPSPTPSPSLSRHTSPEPTSDRERSPRAPPRHIRSPTSPASVRSVSHRAIISPSPLQQQISTSSSSTTASYTTTTSHTHSTTGSGSGAHLRWRSSSVIPDDSEMDSRELGLGEDLDPVQRHFATAYSASELSTFHCDRVRKMPLGGMDPSMLIGFLVKDEADWNDLKQRITELNESNRRAQVVTLQDEPPNWTSDSDMGLESISEPDIDMPEDEDEDEEFSDAQDHDQSESISPNTSPPTSKIKFAEEGDTEDDPENPLTPGAGKGTFVNILPPELIQKSSSTSTASSASSGVDSLSFDDEDDVEWVGHEETTPQPDEVSLAGTEAQGLAASQATIGARASEDSMLTSEGEAAHAKPPRRRKSTKKKTGGKAAPQQFPFPATPGEDEAAKSPPRRVPQMRTAKARDGGRTQSGGVRGVPVDDFDDF